MKLREFILEFTNKTKDSIIELAQTELNNDNKKLALDHSIVEFVEQAICNLSMNWFFKTVLKRLVLPNVSLITQIIYDLLKAKIEGITK